MRHRAESMHACCRRIGVGVVGLRVVVMMVNMSDHGTRCIWVAMLKSSSAFLMRGGYR